MMTKRTLHKRNNLLGLSVTMIKMIKPIVNISKVIEPYNTVIVGFNGVLTDGSVIKPETVEALIGMKKAGKHIVLLSNTAWRVARLVTYLHQNKVPLAVFDSIVTAGEILHYKFKARQGDFAAIGTAYYKIGANPDMGVFSCLDYQPVENLNRADFIYMTEAARQTDVIEDYLPTLEHAASLGIPLVCAGNDTSSYKNGEICLAPGAIAEQYAVLGGKIITVGKPDAKVIAYALDGIPDVKKESVIVIGDNIATDIKGANLLGVAAILISKGVHINFLGEGYIPDVAKTRELAINFDAYPDFVISNLRW